MRRSTDLSAYNRALAMFKPDPDRTVQESSVLKAMAANETQMIYLLTRWAGCTDVGYSLGGLGKKGDAFKAPSMDHILWAMKAIKGFHG